MPTLVSLRRAPPWFWLVLVWLAMTVPRLFIRGTHYEEGTTIGLARGAFQDGHWISPSLYGVRFVERPVLVSWLLGGVGLLTGHLEVWMARLPAVFSILAGAMLVYWLVSGRVGSKAGFFGAMCFLASPTVLQKVTTAEADSVVSMILFGALVVWWHGFEKEQLGVGRFLVVSLILSLAVLVKGPQPLGYFFLGVGGFLVCKRDLPRLLQLGLIGLMPALVVGAWYLAVFQKGDVQLWLSQSRLGVQEGLGFYLWRALRVCGFIAIESLPGLLLAAPFVFRKREDAAKGGDLRILLVAYAGVCTAVLILWPGANGRYAMPAALGIAALAGLAWNEFRSTRPKLARFSVALTCVLLLACVALNLIAIPLCPDRFRQSALRGRRLDDVMRQRTLPIFATPAAVNRNVLAYLPARLRVVTIGDIADVSPPFWLLATLPETATFRAARPLLTLIRTLDLAKPDTQLLLIEQ